MGCEVVLLDASEEMLRIARQQAEAGSTAQRIFFCHAYARQLPELCGAESFDIVVCHNLLEYAEDPFTTVHDIAHVAFSISAQSYGRGAESSHQIG